MLRALFLFLLALTFSVNAAQTAPTSLMIYSRQPQPELKFHLSDADWRWLGIKKELTVATWEPQNQPMDIVLAPATFEGISADYLQIVSRQLGVQPKVLRFNSRAEALMAVSIACLTIYDMAKAIEKGMRIDGIRLLEKRGGKSGDYRAEDFTE